MAEIKNLHLITADPLVDRQDDDRMGDDGASGEAYAAPARHRGDYMGLKHGIDSSNRVDHGGGDQTDQMQLSDADNDSKDRNRKTSRGGSSLIKSELANLKIVPQSDIDTEQQQSRRPAGGSAMEAALSGILDEPFPRNEVPASSSSSSGGLTMSISESRARKFAEPSMTQYVAHAHATALRSRQSSDADRGLVYNPITGVPFRANSPDRGSFSMQTSRFNRSPLLASYSSEQVQTLGGPGSVESGPQERQEGPASDSPTMHSSNILRSHSVRQSLAQVDSPAVASDDDDDDTSVLIMSQSDPGLARLGQPERSMSFQQPRRMGSGRRVSRRSSTRSSSGAAFSPAASFLAGFNRENISQTPKPDAKGQEIGDDENGRYVIGTEIGHGGFSAIKEVYTMQEGEKTVRAAKILPKQPMATSDDENQKLQLQFEHERVIWSYLPKDQPSILPLLAVFDNNYASFCITKRLPGGSLQDLVRRHRRSSTASVASVRSNATNATSGPSNYVGIPLRFARRYIYQLASALRCLHEDLSIVHRDVKLENCLLETHAVDHIEDSGRLILCDFGMADFISPEDRERYCPEGSHPPLTAESSSPDSPQKANKFVGPAPSSAHIGSDTNNAASSEEVGVPGSLPYASPELLRATSPIFDTSIDVWAFGVTCYATIVGRLPFSHQIAAIQREQILKGEWSEESLLGALEDCDCPEDIVTLIRGCLHMQPAKRWSIGQVLGSKFLAPEQEASSD